MHQVWVKVQACLECLPGLGTQADQSWPSSVRAVEQVSRRGKCSPPCREVRDGGNLIPGWVVAGMVGAGVEVDGGAGGGGVAFTSASI